MKYAKQRYIEQIQSKTTGKWSFRVRIKGKIPTKVFSEVTYNSAQIAFMEAKKYRDKCLAGPAVIDSKATLLEVFEGMQEFYNCSYETQRKERVFMNKYINDDNKKFADIDSVYIQNIINRASYIATRNTMSKIKTLFKKMYTYAIERGIVNRDVSIGVILPKPKLSPKKKKVMTDRETLDKFIDYCSNKMVYKEDRFNYPRFLLVGYYTGMRPAEIFSLAKSDIDIKKNVVTVHSSVNRDDDGDYVIGNTKTENANRIIPIHPELLPTLKELLNHEPEKSLLFINRYGTNYNSQVVSSVLAQASKKVGISLNMYQLRHYFIQRLLDNGCQYRTIMELCGHADSSMVILYSRSSQEKSIEAINTL